MASGKCKNGRLLQQTAVLSGSVEKRGLNAGDIFAGFGIDLNAVAYLDK